MKDCLKLTQKLTIVNEARVNSPLRFLKNQEYSTFTGAAFPRLLNSSFDMTGFLFREDGRSTIFSIPERASSPAKNRKDGRYPPRLLLMNSPATGPISSPTPAAVSAYPKIFSLFDAKLEASMEYETS